MMRLIPPGALRRGWSGPRIAARDSGQQCELVERFTKPAEYGGTEGIRFRIQIK